MKKKIAFFFFSLLTPHSSGCHLPRMGRYYLLVAVALLGIAVYRGINLLMLLSYAMLVMMALNLLAAGKSVRRLQGRRRFAEWLFARAPCGVEVQVNNPGRRPRSGLRIEDGWRERAGMWFVDQLPGLGSITLRREEEFPSRRGRHTWGEVTVSSGYPFGLIERRAVLAASEDVIVLPRLGWLHRGRFLRHLRSLAAQPRHAPLRRQPYAHRAAQMEFHGLRAYRGGDSPRLIHWRTSARRGELMVREFEDEPSDNLLLLIDPALPAESDYGGVSLHEQFEEAVSLAATICWEWCRRRDDHLTLATATANPEVLAWLTGPIHARRVLECLAVLQCKPAPSAPAVIARLREQALPPAIVVLLALGRSSLADPLTRALSRPVNCLDATRTDRFDFYTPPG